MQYIKLSVTEKLLHFLYTKLVEKWKNEECKTANGAFIWGFCSGFYLGQVKTENYLQK